MGTAFAIQADQKGLLAPYKVATWGNIPADSKASDATWYDDYGGFVAIGYNPAKVKVAPTSFKDLLNPVYKKQVAINGNPTQASAAFSAVYAAALANGGSLDNIQPGIDFFKKLNQVGNFVPVTAASTTVESNQTPIVIWWDYLLASEIGSSVQGFKIVIPSDGHYAAYYDQAINKDAPHPAAARLWEEYLYSTTGQNLWLAGKARPIELPTLIKDGTVNAADNAALPPARPARSASRRRPSRTRRRRWSRSSGRASPASWMTADTAPAVAPGPAAAGPGARPGRSRHSILRSARDWAGLLPFGVYVGLGLILPTIAIIIGAFQTDDGTWTLSNINTALHGVYLHGLEVSLELSVITAIIPGIIGFLIAYAIFTARRGSVLRRVTITASGMFANFGGVPLAFLFIATLGTTGIATGWLSAIGLNLVRSRVQPVHVQRCGAGLHVLPDPADGSGHPAVAGGPAPGLAGGHREPGRLLLAVLAVRGRPGADARVPGLRAAAVRQRAVRLRHRPGADQRQHPADADPDRHVPERQRAGRAEQRGQGPGPAMVLIIAIAHVAVRARAAKGGEMAAVVGQQLAGELAPTRPGCGPAPYAGSRTGAGSS